MGSCRKASTSIGNTKEWCALISYRIRHSLSQHVGRVDTGELSRPLSEELARSLAIDLRPAKDASGSETSRRVINGRPASGLSRSDEYRPSSLAS